ncbi:membrane protein [Cohaesibacter sp. ES.047]|uniref:YihY/virulence factor BrkB family protein n=1 Tax=Cohaesibacter sp. ES.047 TaxID=1798205 RepID=UPI000BB766B3|nr:YihY/virulence factor BrkB family protein [Cohaesibacter sp. ES.047]SNY93368.1 membrane protein [Cohaesibacter sp. ES.047]
MANQTEQNEHGATESGIGRQARHVRKIPFKGWFYIFRRTVTSFAENRVMLISAGVTLYVLLAMVPGLSLFVSIYGLVSDPQSIPDQIALLQGLVPAETLDLIRAQLVRISAQNDSELNRAFIIALLISLWSASLGAKGMFEAMNVVYGEKEKRNFFTLTGLAFMFTLGGALLAFFALATVVLLPAIVSFVQLGSGLEWLVRIVSYLVFAIGIVLGLSAIYRWGPNRAGAKWRWVTPGAGFAAIAVIATSVVFSWYMSNFANYGASYGSLGAPIGFLTWLWISVIVVVMGGKLNAEAEHQTAMDTTKPPEKPMGERGAFVADTLGE